MGALKTHFGKFFLTCFFALLLAIGGSIFSGNFAEASVSDNVSGYAWSSTIGWLSLNCADPGTCVSSGGAAEYGVKVAASGAISGYAWSPNIGWVSFNPADVAGCPNNPCAPTFDRATGEVSGFARALAGAGRSDGWDGWLSLRGVAADSEVYGVSVNDCAWEGFAWGGPVVGWLSFSGGSYGVFGSGDACEGVPLNACEDGLDNDGDGAFDINDPGCYDQYLIYSPLDNDETDTLPVCSDFFNNDGQGGQDCADSGCWVNPGVCNPNGGSESDSRPQCGNAYDDDNDGLIDGADPGCYTNDAYDSSDNDESNTLPTCGNNFDDDGDGLIDEADPGCWTDPSDPATYDENRSSERRIRLREQLPQ